MPSLLPWLAALLVLGIPGLAAPQGLGETAAREKERRDKESQGKEKEPAPAYTNHDLDAIRPPEAESDDEEDSGDEGQGGKSVSFYLIKTVLGWLFLIAGTVVAFLPPHFGNLMMGATFGGIQICFGLLKMH